MSRSRLLILASPSRDDLMLILPQICLREQQVMAVLPMPPLLSPTLHWLQHPVMDLREHLQ